MASLETWELLRTPDPSFLCPLHHWLPGPCPFQLQIIGHILPLPSNSYYLNSEPHEELSKTSPIKSLLCFQFPFWFPSACRIYFELLSEAYRTLYDLDPTPCPPSVPSIHHSRWTHWLEVSWIILVVPSLCVYAHVIFTGWKIINFSISLKRIDLNNNPFSGKTELVFSA